jgi:hypothetical protein
MKARIIESGTTVYSGAGFSALKIAELTAGSEVEILAVKKQDGRKWMTVTLADGQRGVVPGETRIFTFQHALLLADDATAYAEPCVDSTVVSRYAKNSTFDVIDRFTQDGKPWIRIRDAGGTEGFMPGRSRIKLSAPDTSRWKQKERRDARQSMVYGTSWLIGGILAIAFVIYLASAAASSRSGTVVFPFKPVFVFGLVAVFGGGFRFLMGLLEYLRTLSD